MLALSRRSQQPEMTLQAGDRPTLRSIAPDFAEMFDRRAAMMTRVEEIERELLRITPIVTKAGLYDTTRVGYIPLPPAPPSPPNEKIVSLLGRFMPAEKEEEPQILAPDHPEALRRLAAELSAERETLLEAIKLIDRPMERARLDGSAELSRQLSPEYQLVADRVCEAILALGEAAIANEAWLSELRRQGVALGRLRPVVVQGPNEFEDLITRLRRLLEWAAEGGGWFDPTKIPTEWKARQ